MQEIMQAEQSLWLSTYGQLTAERLFESLGIKLTTKELIQQLKSENSFFHQLLTLPAKNKSSPASG